MSWELYPEDDRKVITDLARENRDLTQILVIACEALIACQPIPNQVAQWFALYEAERHAIRARSAKVLESIGVKLSDSYIKDAVSVICSPKRIERDIRQQQARDKRFIHANHNRRVEAQRLRRLREAAEKLQPKENDTGTPHSQIT
jgi:hypothetical protein